MSCLRLTSLDYSPLLYYSNLNPTWSWIIVPKTPTLGYQRPTTWWVSHGICGQCCWTSAGLVSIAPDTHSWMERTRLKWMGMALKFRRKFKVRVGLGFARVLVILFKLLHVHGFALNIWWYLFCLIVYIN